MSVTTKPPTTVPATVPASNVMPFPMSWSGNPALAGCCPPGGMSNLMQCYCDVQQAQAFICAMMINCIQTNPAVTAAIIAAIEASGSSLPLIGVTNGTDAQPGQVGEFVEFSQNLNFPATPGATVTGTMGVLQPGDWDCWQYGVTTTIVSDLSMILAPVPAGFNSSMNTRVEAPATAEWGALPPALGRASLSVPTLIAVSVGTNFTGAGSGAGVFNAIFCARRRR